MKNYNQIKSELIQYQIESGKRSYQLNFIEASEVNYKDFDELFEVIADKTSDRAAVIILEHLAKKIGLNHRKFDNKPMHEFIWAIYQQLNILRS